MKLKIVSDGTSEGTYICNAETGEKVEWVKSLNWHIEASSLSKATVVLLNVPVEITTEAEITKS